MEFSDTFLMVQWQVKYNTGTTAGVYFYASSPTGEGRGTSYYVKQDASSVYLYKSVNNVLTQQGVGAAANAAEQTHSYAVSYNPTTGVVQVSRDGTAVVSWTDPAPLTTGSYLSLRTDYTDAAFDEVAAYTKNKYYYAGQQRIAVRATGTLYFLLSDHLGSTAVTVDASGVKKAELRYYPYGDVRYTWGTTPTDRQYTGQVLDNSTSLLYYGARYYAYGLGRFVQADTIVPEAGNPQALNRYSYTLNNPLKYTDPSGHFFWVAAGAVAGGGLAYGLQVYNNMQSGMDLSTAMTTNINVMQIANGAALGALTVMAAPAAVAMVGDAVIGARLVTGSTELFAAGMTTVGAAATLGNIVYGAPIAGGLAGVIERGFQGDEALFNEFNATLQEGLPQGTQVAVRGSVVTNQSWKTHLPFDSRGPGTSDIDTALIGKDVMKLWEPHSFYIKGVNTMPLSDETAYVAPELNGLRMRLQEMVGRPVNFQATTNSFLELRRLLLGQPYLNLPPE